MKIKHTGSGQSGTIGLKPLVEMVRQISKNPAALPLITCTLPAISMGAPIGEQIVSGNISINRPDNVTTVINQNSPKSIINWQQFSIASDESVNFIQPGSESVSLNRVVGGDPSAIFGQLTANGQVYLVNTHGVYFGPTAQANVGGLVASAVDIDNNDFLNGSYRFNSDNAGNVQNDGSLSATGGGFIVLVGDSVTNNGSIRANQGQIGLAAGRDVRLVADKSGLVSLSISREALTRAGVTNTGDLLANGGRIYISAAMADALAASAVNNSGLIQANGIQNIGGEIYLTGAGGEMVNNGAIVADGTESGPAGTVALNSNHDIIIESQSLISASGGETDNRGGEVRIVADGTLNLKGGAGVYVEGGQLGGDGGFLELSGKDKIALNGQFSGRAYAHGAKHGSLLIDPQNIRVVTGGTSLNPGGSASALSDSAASTLDIDPNMSGGAWTNVSLNAIRDITVVDQIGDSDVPVGGSLSMLAGRDINVQNNIGDSISAFSHDLSLQADRNINIGASGSAAVGIYLGGSSNQLNITADADSNGSGAVDISGNKRTTVITEGDITIAADQFTMVGGNNNSADTAKLVQSSANISINVTDSMTVTGGQILNGTSTLDASAAVVAGNNLNVNVTTGDLSIQGGRAYTSTSSSAGINAKALLTAANNVAIVTGGNVNVRGGGAHITASSASTATMLADAQAMIQADSDINNLGDLTITAAGLNMQAAYAASGSNSVHATIGDPADVIATGNATLLGENISVNTTGNITISGGKAQINALGSASSVTQVEASASALINAASNATISISSTGDLALSGGNATAETKGSGSASAQARGNAEIRSGNDITITINNGDISLNGNRAAASASGDNPTNNNFMLALAEAKAVINADFDGNNSGDLTVSSANSLSLYGGTGGNAQTATNAASSADASVDASASLAGENISLTLSNDITLRGGSGSANALDLSTSTLPGSGSATATYYADARIDANSNVTGVISDGNLTLTGGNALASGSGSSSANLTTYASGQAEIASVSGVQGNINIDVGGISVTNGHITLSGGTADASGFWSASSSANTTFITTANAGANIVNNGGAINISASKQLGMTGGQAAASPVITGSSASGSASANAGSRIGTGSGATNISVTGGAIALTGNGGSSYSTGSGAIIAQSANAMISGDSVSLVAAGDINLETTFNNTDLPVNATLSFQAGNDLEINGNIGSNTDRFAHDITAKAENDIRIGNQGDTSIYLASNALALYADSGTGGSNGQGSVIIAANGAQVDQGDILINTQGLIDIRGNGFQETGGQASNGSVYTTTTNNINITTGSGGVAIKGGYALASSGSSLDVSAGLNAGGTITIATTGGSLNVQGGVAIASVDSAASSSAVANAGANISAANVDITLNQGSVNISGGSASASIQGMSSSGLIADANANASLSSGTTGTVTITADGITVTGGTATVTAFDGSSFGASSINALATANTLLYGNNVDLTLSGNLSVRGGDATAYGAASSSGTGVGSASATAAITADNNLDIDVGSSGTLSVTGGSALAAAATDFYGSSFSGTGYAFANANSAISGKQNVTIANSGSVTVTGGSANAGGVWTNSSASGASFLSLALADAAIKSTLGNITVNANQNLTLRGGNATASPELAGSTSGIGSGSASASAKSTIAGAGTTNIVLNNGDLTWSGGGSSQASVTGGTTQRSETVTIDGTQINVGADSVFIASDGNISLPVSAVYVIGNGTQSAASGDAGMLNAMSKNLIAGPETNNPNLKIVSSGDLSVESDITLTGTNPYAWFIADQTSIDTLNFPSATAATLQYTPYSNTIGTGVENLSSLSASYPLQPVTYYDDTHFDFVDSLNSANIIVGGSSYSGTIIAGQGGPINLGNANIGLLTADSSGVQGEDSLQTNGTIFTFQSSAFAMDTVVPVSYEFDFIEYDDVMTEKEKKSRKTHSDKPLIKITTR